MDTVKKRERNLQVERHIVEAALDTVETYTISGTRMHLIAERADMLQSNLHYYFKTKDELMTAVQKRVLERCIEIRNDLSKVAEKTLEAEFDVFIGQKRKFILQEKKYDHAEIDFWLQGRLNPEMQKSFAMSYENWRRDIRRLLEKYVPNLPSKDLEYLPYHFVSMLEGATIQYLTDEEAFDLDEYFQYAKHFFLAQVAPYR